MSTTLSYILGGLCGLAFGALIGVLKYATLWRPLLKKRRPITKNSIVGAEVISMAANVAALLTVFLLRNVMPFNFFVVIVGTAVALSVLNRLSPLRDISKMQDVFAAEAARCTPIPYEDDEEEDDDWNGWPDEKEERTADADAADTDAADTAATETITAAEHDPEKDQLK